MAALAAATIPVSSALGASPKLAKYTVSFDLAESADEALLVAYRSAYRKVFEIEYIDRVSIARKAC